MGKSRAFHYKSYFSRTKREFRNKYVSYSFSVGSKYLPKIRIFHRNNKNINYINLKNVEFIYYFVVDL